MPNERARWYAARGLANSLRFDVAAMETLDEVVGGTPFDAAFVYEALHHAFDWRKALGATLRCLKPGGWLILANEPNLLHTFISYRFAKLTKVHDIGMSRRQLVSTLRAVGFSEVRVLRPRLNDLVSFHWIAARR
jgi:SAM-dependent methyltransferase